MAVSLPITSPYLGDFHIAHAHMLVNRSLKASQSKPGVGK